MKRVLLPGMMLAGALLSATPPVQAQQAGSGDEEYLRGLERTAEQAGEDMPASDADGIDPMVEPDPSALRGEIAQPKSEETGTATIVRWSKADARSLVAATRNLRQYALDPRGYRTLGALESAIGGNDPTLVDVLASRLFSEVIVDLRDGVTPMNKRVDWYVKDSDADKLPTDTLMRIALQRHDIEGIFQAAQPTHPDYWRLLDAYAATPESDVARRRTLAVNIDRWRWLPRTLGDRYIYVNVPQFETELIDDGDLIARHKVVVGKKSTPTPQLVSDAKGAIFNPKWYLPQSIIAEGIGHTIRTNPAAARAKGYTWSTQGGTLYVIQGAGPGNALGMVKLDMPNPHAIYLHDTPAKYVFDREKRAFSHGCIRTEHALLFMGMLAVRYADKTKEDLQAIMESGETTPIAFRRPLPVYILYFTASPDDNGAVRFYEDLYDRDAPVSSALNI